MAVAAITTALSTFHISKPYSIARNHLRYHTLSIYSLSSSSSEFITTSGYLLTDKKLVDPWRGDASSRQVFHVMADASAVNSPTKKKLKPSRELRPIREMTSEPRYSKAARRFYNENFKESSSQRLSKVLAAAGVASRRSREELIFEGKVTVNGSACNTPQTKVDPKKDMIYVNGNRLPKKLPPKVYLALNKPKGCTFLYDTLRPKLIHETNLDGLCELVDILKIEVIGEHLSRRSESLAGIRPTLDRILADIHERLTFRARTHIRDEIANYLPLDEDLDYPGKLEQSPGTNSDPTFIDRTRL